MELDGNVCAQQHHQFCGLLYHSMYNPRHASKTHQWHRTKKSRYRATQIDHLIKWPIPVPTNKATIIAMFLSDDQHATGVNMGAKVAVQADRPNFLKQRQKLVPLPLVLGKIAT